MIVMVHFCQEPSLSGSAETMVKQPYDRWSVASDLLWVQEPQARYNLGYKILQLPRWVAGTGRTHEFSLHLQDFNAQCYPTDELVFQTSAQQQSCSDHLIRKEQERTEGRKKGRKEV